MNTISEALIETFNDRLKFNFPLAGVTTFKIGGNAEYFIEAKSSLDLIKVKKISEKLGIPLTILGGGSNVLISDQGVSGLVVRNNNMGINIIGIKGTKGKSNSVIEEVYLKVQSGTPMNQVVRYSIEESLSGIEMHLGLPGSVGGAVYMNSKWTNPKGYISDVVSQGTIIDRNGDLNTVPYEYFKFDYGYSYLKENNDILSDVVFKFIRGNKNEIWNKANLSIKYRRETQPQGKFCAGCIFRNLTKAEAIIASTPQMTTSAGYLIDHSGLKGAHIGKAQISDIHANFIINSGEAKAEDVIKLIDKIQKRVKDQFKVNLKEEIILIGNF